MDDVKKLRDLALKEILEAYGAVAASFDGTHFAAADIAVLRQDGTRDIFRLTVVKHDATPVSGETQSRAGAARQRTGTKNKEK